MIEFFHRLLNLAKPYRLRLVLGIVFGFLSGLVDPLLVLVIPLVGLVVFTGAGADSAVDRAEESVAPSCKPLRIQSLPGFRNPAPHPPPW